MTPRNDRLLSIWENTRPVDFAGRSGFYLRRYFEGPGPDLRLGHAVPSGERVLVLASAGRVPLGFEAVRLRGLSASVHQSSSQPSTLLVVTLGDEAFCDLFDVLAVDLIEAVASVSEPEGPDVFAARLLLWKDLFDRSRIGGLSRDEQTGLFGELLFLERLLGEGVAMDAAVAMWQGPRRADRDFEHRLHGVEIKTTTGRLDLPVRISSLAQLDAGALESLHLLRVGLVEDPEGRSLNDLVDGLRARSPALAAALNLELVRAGYLDAHRERYGSPSFSVARQACYRVGQGFPALTLGNVPEGVVGARYELSPFALAAFACDPHEPVDLFLAAL